MRIKILKFIYYKILNIKSEGAIPKNYMWIYRLFFPIKYYLMNNETIKFDYVTGTFIIYGVRYSDELFKTWSLIGEPTGFFSFKNENNIISLRRELPKEIVELDLIDWFINNKSKISKSKYEILANYYKDKRIS
jgi:hypothetical protein